MINKTIKKFLSDLESKNEFVGSGTSSSLLGSMALSLANKAILLTQSAKKFNSYDKKRKELLEESSMKINTFKSSFDRLINGYIKANEDYYNNKDENTLGVLVNNSYSMALTCIETIITFDSLKEALNKQYLDNLLIASIQIKDVYEFSMLDLKMKTGNNINDDLADFLIQKEKILSDIKAIINYCERKI